MKKLIAFTLAEVIIVLAIIGVVATLTIPTVIENTYKQEYRVGLKKAISVLNQAILMNYALVGKGLNDYRTSQSLMQMFSSRLNVIRTGYFGDGTANIAFITADGMRYELYVPVGTQCDANGYTPFACAFVGVDVNGERPPNMQTQNFADPKDRYFVALFANRAVPWGSISQDVAYDRQYVIQGVSGITGQRW